MKLIEIIIGIIVIVAFILGIIGVIIEKIRTGNWWNGQGYGK